ncbi:MAG: cation:proton antiporter [Pelovirga sp.]
MPEPYQIIFALAVVLLAALIGGRVALLCRVPRVTGYIFAGILVGPSFADLVALPQLITPSALGELKIISDVALTLILMNIGSQLRAENLRRWKSRIFLFSASETLTTALLVGSSIFLVNLLFLQQSVTGMTLWQSSAALGTFCGIIAIATAPAITLMVIRENEAEGSITNLILTLVSLNNLCAVLLFSFAVQLLLATDGSLLTTAYQLVIPLAIGSLGGFLMSLWAQRLEQPSEFKLLLLGGVTAVAIASRYLGLEPLLACLALGTVMADSSPRWHRLVKALSEIDYPLYVVFFVLAGAKLDIVILFYIGPLGLAYILARSAGKVLGSALGARIGGYGQRERAWVGMTLLGQGAMAIGLATTLGRTWPEGGQVVESMVLGAVIVFEVIGPLAVRHGLVKSGEVPLLSLLRKRAPRGTLEGFHDVANYFRSNLGLPAGHKLQNPGDILVRHVMRQNVETVNQSMPFQQLLQFISHSRYDRFPVVDDDNNFVGIINYTDIRTLLFDPSMSKLLMACDLVSTPSHSIAPDISLREALKILQKKRNISYFPVIDPEEPNKLLGILNQNDVLAAFRRLDLDS